MVKTDVLPGNWKDISSYLSGAMLASDTKNREDLINSLFLLLAELICRTYGPSDEGFGWDDDFGIICRTQAEAETIADIFDAAAGTKIAITGTWDREEDERNGEVNEYTGHSYVRIWD